MFFLGREMYMLPEIFICEILVLDDEVDDSVVQVNLSLISILAKCDELVQIPLRRTW
jgi:hypothetical protein